MLSYSFKGVYVLEMMIISFWVRRQSTSNAKNKRSDGIVQTCWLCLRLSGPDEKWIIAKFNQI